MIRNQGWVLPRSEIVQIKFLNKNLFCISISEIKSRYFTKNFRTVKYGCMFLRFVRQMGRTWFLACLFGLQFIGHVKEMLRVKEIQRKLLSYFENNVYFVNLFKFDGIMAVIYPIYLLSIKGSLLSTFWYYGGTFLAILQIAYIVGTVLCFAENKLIPLDIAFGCMALNALLKLQYGITFNRLTSFAFYAFIAGVCIKSTKEK